MSDSFSSPPEKPTLQDAIEVFQSETDRLDAAISYGLSDLSESDVDSLRKVWPRLDATYRRKVMQHLIDISEANFELNYGVFGMFATHDADANVRAFAIELLWEDESLALMRRLLEIAQWDEDAEVRANAIGALGRFILLGEYEDIDQREAEAAQDIAAAIWNNTDEHYNVRRRALEAISNSSNDQVPDMIREAYESDNRTFQISSLYAMGRSCDDQWEAFVLRELQNNDAAMRYEAARACGELQLADAVNDLVRLAQHDDREIQEVSIWALGEIGQGRAREALNALAEDVANQEDPDLLEAIEDAIANADLNSFELPGFIDVDTDA